VVMEMINAIFGVSDPKKISKKIKSSQISHSLHMNVSR
jgi:hypothetical protein